MAKYEARVKTKFGEIVINFDSLDELKSNIETLDVGAVSDSIYKKFESIFAKEIRRPKEGFEGIYNFTLSGLVELVVFPKSKAEKVALVLFAYYPEPASTEQVSLSSGVKEISVYLAHTKYKKFWSRTQDGRCVLSSEGLDWVAKIVAKLKASKETAAKAHETPRK